MIEKIVDNIYKIVIPLPKNPLRALNAYFIRGDERNLLIDTGFNQKECQEAMDQAMNELSFSMDNTDLFITHIHSDHSGLVGYLASPQTHIYTGKYCADSLSQGMNSLVDYYDEMIEQSGLKKMGLSNNVAVHPGYRYKSENVDNITVVQDNEEIRVGEFTFQCLRTTGHAPDHFCLYEKEKKILFSGDHILGRITPNNGIWSVPWMAKVDYLNEYFNSLAKIQELDIELTLPGHRGIITNCYERIIELKEHHERRLENILTILGHSAMTGAEVASHMKWDLRIKKWGDFPDAQKIFATQEALSHLIYLVFNKVVVHYLSEGVVYFRRK